MCGIIGQYSVKNDLQDFIKRRDLMVHRGPDDSGILSLLDNKLLLGHRRLSILDLSENGKQPMEIDGYVIVYNGEVYNFNELKKNIPGNYFSSTDTEVILRGYIKFGKDIFKKLNGMFSLAIYDPINNEIILARDRIGIKPLYYKYDKAGFQFASEMQSIKSTYEINLEAVKKFMQQNYIYGNGTIKRDIKKLPPANYAVFKLTTNDLKIYKYWDQRFFITRSSKQDAASQFKYIFSNTIKKTLISDVPIGVFLSSGVDSSLIAAMSREYVKELKTYTIGFDFSSYDESKKSKTIAKYLGVKHNTIVMNKAEIINEVPKILDYFNEPFGDSSAIPFYFLSKFARSEISVALSGDGADEFFGGYPIYYLPGIANVYRKIPYKKVLEKFVNNLPTSFSKMSLDYKLKRFIYAANHNFTKAHFHYRIMHNKGIFSDEKNSKNSDFFSEYFSKVKNEEIVNQLMFVDQKTVLEGDYLVKADRMSMANSLEVRLPFLNSEIIEFGNSLSPDFKVRKFKTKILLKKVLEEYLPNKLIYSKKKGFNIPMGLWLRNELRDFMLETLSRENVSKWYFLNYEKIDSMMKEHLKGDKDYNRELWGLISLARYLNKNF